MFHRGGLRELTELLRKEKKTRLVWARSYKFKPVFSTTFCTKHVNKKLIKMKIAPKYWEIAKKSRLVQFIQCLA